MKILIIDDSLMDRKLLQGVLKKGSITNEILEANDGEEGFKILHNNYKDIAVVFLDWQMPNVDGISFMKAVVQVPYLSQIPIIMVTASGSDENKRYAHSVNPNLAGYIVKPYKPSDLLEKLKENLPE